MDPFIGEIRCFGFHFAPQGWAFCNGQLMPISQNAALYAIIGTTYGGDGQSTMGLPNLQGNIPMHWGTGPGGFNTVIGEVQGTTTVTLLTTQIPSHSHSASVASVPSGGSAERTAKPTNASYISASSPPSFIYQTAPGALASQFSPKAISPAGGSQPHENMQPYLTLNFCMALEGIFPSRN